MALPGAPTGLSSPLAGSGYVDLVWTAPADDGGETITGYSVDYSSDAGATWITFPTVATTFTSVQPLTASMTYTFRVAAINASGTGPYSDTITASTTGAPPPPGGAEPPIAISYYEGAFASQPTGLDAMAAIRTAFETAPHAGWQFVEEWTENSTTWHAYKCNAASSGLPYDFHVILADTSAGSSNLSVALGEGYDTTAHRLKRAAITYTNSTITPPAAADGSLGDDATLYRPASGSNALSRTAGTGSSSGGHMAAWSLTAGTSNWAVIFYPDGMCITTKDSTLRYAYFGAFTSLVKDAAINDPMPVFYYSSGMTAATSNAAQGFTRSAMNAGLTGYHNLSVIRWHNATLGGGAPSEPLTADKYSATEGVYLMPLMITRGGTSTDSSSSTLGKVRGRAKYILWSGSAGTVGWGDTVTVDGAVYQAISTTAWALKSQGA